MAKVFMPEATADERMQILRNNADKIEENAYYDRDLSEDELVAKREEFVSNSINMDTLNDEIGSLKKTYKAKIDKVKVVNKGLQYEIKTKRAAEKGTLFHMANQESGYMETYNEAGEMVYERRLRPDERQARLYIPHKAANDQ